MPTLTFEALDAALTRAKLGVSPADLHGSVTGYLCAGGRSSGHALLTALALESGDAGMTDELHALLDAMATDLSRRLRRGEPITPLLPLGPLAARADAMVDWCRGFLGGLALTGELAKAANPPEIRELLDGKKSIQQCVAAIQQATRRYAKRQLTWFRRQTNFQPLNLSLLSQNEAVKEISQLASSFGVAQGND